MIENCGMTIADLIILALMFAVVYGIGWTLGHSAAHKETK